LNILIILHCIGNLTWRIKEDTVVRKQKCVSTERVWFFNKQTGALAQAITAGDESRRSLLFQGVDSKALHGMMGWWPGTKPWRVESWQPSTGQIR